METDRHKRRSALPIKFKICASCGAYVTPAYDDRSLHHFELWRVNWRARLLAFLSSGLFVMGGSLSTVLCGLSTPVARTRWDHTYVASGCGWVWRCWGAHSGGHSLSCAVGSSMLANCLSEPAGTAEVVYGISGVCHQTANRILLPAQTRVSSARGYNVSFKTFGHYGRSWLPGWAAWLARLALCMGAPPTSPLLVDHVRVDRQKVLGKDTSMTDDTRGSGDDEKNAGPTLGQLLSYMNSEGGTIDRVREMCNPQLEQPLARHEEMALAEIQDWFEDLQKAHVSSFESGKIGRQGYLDGMNDLLAQSMGRYRGVLGEVRFIRVFGETGYEPDKLIDRATFLGG